MEETTSDEPIRVWAMFSQGVFLVVVLFAQWSAVLQNPWVGFLISLLGMLLLGLGMFLAHFLLRNQCARCYKRARFSTLKNDGFGQRLCAACYAQALYRWEPPLLSTTQRKNS